MENLLIYASFFAGGFVAAKSLKRCPETGWCVCLCWLRSAATRVRSFFP